MPSFKRPNLLSALVSLTLACVTIASSSGAPRITELMASSKMTLVDEDGAFSDWLEIFNPDATAVDLSGWYLTDNVTKKTKWQFPAGVVLGPGSYLLAFLSDKDRRDASKPLHANFSLSADGEYLGLVMPDGITIASEYAPKFPAQTADISYGLDQTLSAGFLEKPSPGTGNGGLKGAALMETVTFSVPAGTFVSTTNLELGGATAGNVIRYERATPSASGAEVPFPTVNSLVYSAPLAIDVSTIVRAAVFSADGSRHGDATSSQYIQLSSSGAGFSTQLPILVLDNHGNGPLPVDDTDHANWVHLFTPDANGNTALSSASSISIPATFKIRGSSSALFPKKGYNLELSDAHGKEAAKSILGMPASSNWSLISPWFYDRAYIRNSYVYALSTQLGRWAPRTSFVEVFFHGNGEALGTEHYAGISFLSDRIKIAPDRVNITPLATSDVSADAVTGGYILKIDDPDADHDSFATTRAFPEFKLAGTAVVVAEPKASKLASAQRDYIHQYVQGMEDALYADRDSGWVSHQYLNYVDLASWVDYHLLNILVGNVDAGIRSFYFHKDRGGKLIAGPQWDFDRSLGSADLRNRDPRAWVSLNSFDPWTFGWFGVMALDPEFMQAWVDRWQSLRRSSFAGENLGAIADSIAAQIPAAAAARDAATWPDNIGRFGNGFNGEVAFLKDWIKQRGEWIDAQFVAQPSATSPDGKVFIVTPPAGALLVYTQDGSDPRASGGALAPGATVSGEPVTINDNSLFRVRSYRPDFVGRFPGSPWSSASTLAGIRSMSRIVNLSSRGVAGKGEATLIMGMVVNSEGSQQFLVRAVGPGLAQFGIDNFLRDPVLRVVDNAGREIATNENWMTGNAPDDVVEATKSVSAFPLVAGAGDSSLVVRLPPGVYTVTISSASNTSGVALGELYQLDQGSRAMNLSTRTRVHTKEGLLIGGIVVRGNQPKRLMFRAVGPGLSKLGVQDFLPDPVLTVYSQEKIIGGNDDWNGSGEMSAAASSAGAFPLDSGSKDAVLTLELLPGSYTLQVTGKNETQGIALVEVYELPNGSFWDCAVLKGP